MKKTMISMVRKADSLFNSAYLNLAGENKSLIIFLFHALLRNEEEGRLNIIQPFQGVTVGFFRKFVEYFLKQGYNFISPEDILNGLDKNKNFALVTFDDGYYNNRLALDILNQYKIPAVFFISADCVKYGKPYWWDVLYREKLKLKIPSRVAIEKINLLSSSRAIADIEKYITDKFGRGVFKFVGDIDRPFTPDELRDFSKEKFVFIGNHTTSHAYLGNCTPREISSTILGAQKYLLEVTGTAPAYISYPHGSYSGEVIKIVKQAGFKLGMAVDNRKNYLPIDLKSDNRFQLGRFALREDAGVVEQCRLCRADIRLTRVLKNFIPKSKASR